MIGFRRGQVGCVVELGILRSIVISAGLPISKNNKTKSSCPPLCLSM